MRFDDRHEVVVTGPWTPEMTHAVESGIADRVVLNYALGYDEPDLRFLEYLPIRELVILDRRITDLTPVYTLAPKLELLHLTTDPDLRLDLTELTNLRHLRADWDQVADTIHAAHHLESAALGHYQPADLHPLSHATKLTALTMKDRPKITSLDGLGALPHLTHLGIFGAAQLSDISALLGRDHLHTLTLQACPKITTIDALQHCTGLRILNLAEGGAIASAASLAGLTNLEELYLYDTTSFTDGDLTPIAQLPHLHELRIKNRRHYRPSSRDIQTALAARSKPASVQTDDRPSV